MSPLLLIPLMASEAAPVTPEPVYAWSAPYSITQSDAGESHTEKRTYLRLNGGLVTTESSGGPDEEIDFDEGYLLAAAFGWRLGASDTGLGFSIELEGLWTDQDADDDGPIEAISDLSVLGGMLNGVLDFRFADSISLYAGAGVGAAWLNVGTESDSLGEFDDEDGPFLAWQARAGLAFHLSHTTSLSFGYRFLNVDDVNIDDGAGDPSFDLETQQHALEIGLVFGI